MPSKESSAVGQDRWLLSSNL